MGRTVNNVSRSHRRQSTKSALRKQCQNQTKGAASRARKSAQGSARLYLPGAYVTKTQAATILSRSDELARPNGEEMFSQALHDSAQDLVQGVDLTCEHARCTCI